MQKTESDTIIVQVCVPSSRRDNPAGKTTVYFDGSCPLCTAEIGHYASRHGGDQLSFVDVSQVAADCGPGLEVKEAMQRFHVRLPDGRLESGARAFAVIWETLPGWRWLARIARLPGITPLLEVGYRLFLPVRPSLSKLASRLGARPASRHEG